MSGFGENLVATGACIGTGAALNIECGFTPRIVQVYNLTQLSRTTLISGMTTNWDEGFHEIDSGAGAVDFSALTANGLAVWAGAAPLANLTGTYAVTAGAATVTGTSSEYLSELVVGDEVMSNGVVYGVVAIASDTSITLDRPAATTVSGGTLVRVTGRQAGFTIGTTSTLNTNNDVISWAAWR